MFFLRHLANMSRMVPFWASTDSGSVPIWGPRPKPCCPEEGVYFLNDSCSHFTQHLFPLRVPQHTRDYFLLCAQYIEYHSCLLYITFIHTFTSLFTCLIHDFISSNLPGRLAARGFLCPIQLVHINILNALLKCCKRTSVFIINPGYALFDPLNLGLKTGSCVSTLMI